MQNLTNVRLCPTNTVQIELVRPHRQLCRTLRLFRRKWTHAHPQPKALQILFQSYPGTNHRLTLPLRIVASCTQPILLCDPQPIPSPYMLQKGGNLILVRQPEC
ncbi:hypothetical protein D3C81_1650080 [compost metagenome]